MQLILMFIWNGIKHHDWQLRMVRMEHAGGSARSRYRCFDIQSYDRLWHLQMSSPVQDSGDYTQDILVYCCTMGEKGDCWPYLFYVSGTASPFKIIETEQWHQQAGPRHLCLVFKETYICLCRLTNLKHTRCLHRGKIFIVGFFFFFCLKLSNAIVKIS